MFIGETVVLVRGSVIAKLVLNVLHTREKIYLRRSVPERNIASNNDAHMPDSQRICIDVLHCLTSTVWKNFEQETWLSEHLWMQSSFVSYKLSRAAQSRGDHELFVNPTAFVRRLQYVSHL